MSLVITQFVREGIVMAADSRMTLNTSQQTGPNQITQVAAGLSDSTFKLFLAPNRVGIATAGDASIANVPLSGYIESFISEELADQQLPVDEVPQKVLDYFTKLPGPPNTIFHVAGYKLEGGHHVQHVYRVSLAERKAIRSNNPNEQGLVLDGEGDILAKLIQRVAVIDAENNVQQVLPWFSIPWQFFTLQDAIDFSVYAVKVTIDSLRFQPRAKTVGGPIDVLVIKPSETTWISRKELHI